MPKRSYKQHCALARALDVVGERWTLLLIRELLTGPKRYRELMANLPGMGTNLLAARLRELTAAGLIDHDEPTYLLTPRGAALEPAVLALASWGAPILAAEPRADAHWSASWNVVALKYSFRPERAKKLRAVFEFQVDGVVAQARVHEGQIETSPRSAWSPDLVIRTTGATLLALSTGEQTPEQAEASDSLEIEGSRRLFRTCLRLFALE